MAQNENLFKNQKGASLKIDYKKPWTLNISHRQKFKIIEIILAGGLASTLRIGLWR